METWVPVPVGERRQWIQDVQDLDAESQIQCFILARTRGRDGPWAYVLFVLDPVHPDILTAYFATVEEEALEGGYNPLDSGGMSLMPDEGYDLIELLEAQASNLTSNGAASGPSFQLLSKEECAEFHIVADTSEFVDQYFYLQVQTRRGVSDNKTSTIILFSKERPHHGDGPYADIMFSIAMRTHFFEKTGFDVIQFANSELQRPGYQPFDHALHRIFLDGNDIQSLVALLRKHLP